MGPVITIRSARLADVAAISALAFAAKAHWGYVPEMLQVWRQDLTVSAADIETKIINVAEVNGLIVGWFGLSPNDSLWELSHLWVSPQTLRQGIGRTLLLHATAIARKAGVPAITIDADPHAEAFYMACGAVRTGSLPAPIPGEPDRLRPQMLLMTATEN